MSTAENETKKSPELKGLHIRRMNYAFIVILSCLAVVLFFLTSSIYTEYSEVTELADNYNRIQKDGQDVNEASDELTQDVQLFVMRGDTAFLDAYFREVNETRRRELAIENLKHMNVQEELIELLEKSVDQSMELMELEYLAIRYAAEGYHIPISSLPEVIQSVPLPAEAESMSDEEKLKTAADLVFGDKYYAYKDRIEQYEQEYLNQALNDLSALQVRERSEMKNLLLMQHISLLLITAISIILFFTISHLIVNPLHQAVKQIAAKDKIVPIEGTYEIKYMAETYNAFHRDSMEIQRHLKQDAERDSLTGVLNRRGHQTVIDALSSETYPIAFLLIDIDNFKHVNDNFGHETGDAALKKVARILLNTFRTTDITSRVGGDEFVVIMGNITESKKSVIEEKAKIINDLLSIPGPDKCPALTVSIGCSFSSAGYNDHLFNESDSKMYEIKRAGGKGIRF